MRLRKTYHRAQQEIILPDVVIKEGNTYHDTGGHERIVTRIDEDGVHWILAHDPDSCRPLGGCCSVESFRRWLRDKGMGKLTEQELAHARQRALRESIRTLNTLLPVLNEDIRRRARATIRNLEQQL